MKLTPRILALAFAGVSLHAGTVDVTSAESVVVAKGDTLSFELFTGSYTVAAQQFGLPVYAEMLRFCLVTAPTDPGAQFSATVRTDDASIFLELGDVLDFSPGFLSSTGFQGAVSTLQGQFQFDSQLSQNLFGSGPVWLDFTNQGSDITLGLSPLFLNHDLYASLSGGPLSVGAVTGTVVLRHPVPSYAANPFGNSVPVDAFSLPEPGTPWMLVGGGALLAAFSRRFGWLSRARK
jgi:hypothetical protein